MDIISLSLGTTSLITLSLYNLYKHYLYRPVLFIYTNYMDTISVDIIFTDTISKDTTSPRHKHWPAGPAHFSERRTSSGQYILSVTGPYGPPRYMSGHQISNSAGPNDDNSQCVFFARSPVPHLGSFRAALLLQRDASVSRVRVWHVNQTHWRQCLDHAALQRDPGRIRALFSAKHMSWFRVNSFCVLVG